MKKLFFTLAVLCLAAPCFARGAARFDAVNEALTPSGMSYTKEMAKDSKLQSVILHGDAALSETITVSLNSYLGASYDTILRQVTLSSEKNLVWFPDGEIILRDGDAIDITSTYNNTSATVYGVIQTEDWQ